MLIRMKMKWPKRIVLFTLFAINLVDQPAPEVKIEQGILSGKVSDDGLFFQYVGIPYATTNSSVRFKAPLPAPSWEGVYKAIDEIYSCPQIGPLGVFGVEDCLKINVFTPSMVTRPLLPVMVYIHGGAFSLGSGTQMIYGADFIVKKDVILVTFNYRLGVLGFTCLNIKEAPGNAGLKDQLAALRWVKKNIAAFGGDPDNITLFGQSAGGVSTSILMASNITNGLFHKAIVMSGSSIASWAVNRDPVWVSSLIAKELGYDVKDSDKIYELFSRLPYKELVAAKPKKPLGKYLDTELLFLPCIEKPFDGEEFVINDLPHNILLAQQLKNIPLIYGSTSKEGLIVSHADTEEILKIRNEKYLFATDLVFPSEEEADAVDNKLREVYFGNRNMSMKTIANITQLMTDLYFDLPGVFESEIMLSKINAPVYNYYFDYSGNRNVLKYMIGKFDEPGACHGDELLYLFKGKLWPFSVNKRDQNMIELITKLWTNFAKFSDPTASSGMPLKWSPSKKDSLKFLHIDDEPKMGVIRNEVAYQLWKDIYKKYRRTNFSIT